MPIEQSNPTRRDLLVFALLWVVFCSLVGLVVAQRPGSLLHAGVFTFVCAMVAIAFDDGTSVRRKLAGLLIPVTLLGCWLARALATRIGVGPEYTRVGVSWGFVAAGVLGTGLMLASKALATGIYRFWMDATRPIGWTVSAGLLAVVYFAVITPIGLALRAFGYDPMARGFDQTRSSYWEDRPAPAKGRRYFRQF